MSGYFVIGKSLPHTLSPQIHKAFGAKDYGVAELSDDDALRAFIYARDFDGINVTIPYKETIIPMLDEVDHDALDVGAVNTVVNENGRLKGYNTDVAGMTNALEAADIEILGKNVLILGSGGTCKTAMRVCRNLGAKSISVVSRGGEINYGNCYKLADTNVIINTTPVGMMPSSYAKPIELSRFSNLSGVFDCIYNPLETLLIKEGRKMGLKADNGLRMLVEQARVAHNLFALAKGEGVCEKSETEKVFTELLSERRNIVLIGMAGSGKSMIAKTLGRKLGKEVVDTDELVERTTGKSIPDIFAGEGEEAFRMYEEEAVKDACGKLGIIIATGGGAVLSQKNGFYMKANGICALIVRDPDMLATAGRPLSDTAQKAKELFEKRKPIYDALADITVINDSSVDDAANKIISFVSGE